MWVVKEIKDGEAIVINKVFGLIPVETLHASEYPAGLRPGQRVDLNYRKVYSDDGWGRPIGSRLNLVPRS